MNLPRLFASFPVCVVLSLVFTLLSVGDLVLRYFLIVDQIIQKLIYR
ncbi:hypothetical protein PC116_g14765 [Phytophthora cactorum]|uniref:Uncharacterized protein n=1 Tax=Phytophthora cactorum TaxID=29920 RepID=A0A8T0Z3B6_9STRA|nr:hypothetical protein PC113_g11637 [Phytophthora cactorum]KAG2904179.1 hypothetical protein PC114_g11947 [Phytophthora cactorum]KAG2919186.1 hypothetical protein PC115_g10214 [Phytophthora cactorum]KAG2937799.1 hypothetical protein PC117_g11529 [Phytophthora cactorum]KAG2980870.1 hypothetical protein PC118_g10927 [Phytophthora cactorum]